MVLIVELDGEVAQVARECIAQSAEQRLKIWKGCKRAFSAVGRLSPDYVVQDGVVPRGQLGRALAEIRRLSGEYSLRIANVFHAGDGNLHPLILYDGQQPDELERAEELAGKIEYVPDEYAFTAYAGTPVLPVTEELARHGQYLPFDPLLIRRGGTFGGTVAAGRTGPVAAFADRS